MPTAQVGPEPPTLTDEELAYHLLAEGVVVEEARQGRDMATLELVIEAEGLLTLGQIEGLGAPTAQAVVPSLAGGQSQLSIAVVVQLHMVVANWLPQPELLPPAVYQPPVFAPVAP